MIRYFISPETGCVLELVGNRLTIVTELFQTAESENGFDPEVALTLGLGKEKVTGKSKTLSPMYSHTFIPANVKKYPEPGESAGGGGDFKGKRSGRRTKK